MGDRVKDKCLYNFRKGEKYHLDSIYEVQAIGGNDWWEPIDQDSGDEVVITRDHKFIITIYDQ